MQQMKTYMARPSEIEPKWWLVDANDKVVGRLASDLAMLLMGKNRPTYTPHVDNGDYVVVINADKAVFTGKKWEQKMYRRHSGYIGGLSEISARELHKKDPTAIVRIAVKGMLPRGPLGRKLYKKLKVYAGAEHPHQAQNPRNVDVKEL